jgi:hypothetical protein
MPTIKEKQDMKRIRLLGLALIAVFAFGALGASSALAEGPTITPAGTEAEPVKFEAPSNGETALETEGKAKLNCLTALGKGSFTTANSGTVLSDFEGCLEPSTLAKCNSPNDNAGVILALLNIKIVDVLPTGTLDLGVWLEPKEETPGTGDLTFKYSLLKTTIFGAVVGVADNAAGITDEPGPRQRIQRVMESGKKQTGDRRMHGTERAVRDETDRPSVQRRLRRGIIRRVMARDVQIHKRGDVHLLTR